MRAEIDFLHFEIKLDKGTVLKKQIIEQKVGDGSN